MIIVNVGKRTIIHSKGSLEPKKSVELEDSEGLRIVSLFEKEIQVIKHETKAVEAQPIVQSPIENISSEQSAEDGKKKRGRKPKTQE